MEELNQAPATTEAPQTKPRDVKGRFTPQAEPPRNQSVRESLMAALEETKRNAEPPGEGGNSKTQQAEPEKPATHQELPEPEDDAEEGQVDLSEHDEGEGERSAASDGHERQEERQPASKPQASKSEPPASWTKQGRAIWDNLPPLAQQEVIKREADTQKGVEKLKDQYRELEEAVSPYKAMIRSMGRTEGAAIRGLFDWQMALAGPNKADAFRQLAANLGVDLRNLVTDEAPPTPQTPGADVPHELKPVLDQYASKITALDQEVNHWKRTQAEQQQSQANQMIEKWAENKPHFADVRELMGQLINSELATVQAGRPSAGRFIKNGNIDLDAAYDAAVYAHPDIRSQILAEQAAKKTEEARTKAKTEVKGAKKAGVSVRPNAPTAPVPAFQPRKPGQPESVRASILRAMAESTGR